MIALFKGLFPGILLTWVVTGIMGSQGSKGGFLFIHLIYISGNSTFHIGSHSFYWSWPLFVASTGMAAFIFKIME